MKKVEKKWLIEIEKMVFLQWKKCHSQWDLIQLNHAKRDDCMRKKVDIIAIQQNQNQRKKRIVEAENPVTLSLSSAGTSRRTPSEPNYQQSLSMVFSHLTSMVFINIHGFLTYV